MASGVRVTITSELRFSPSSKRAPNPHERPAFGSASPSHFLGLINRGARNDRRLF